MNALIISKKTEYQNQQYNQPKQIFFQSSNDIEIPGNL